MHTVSYVNAFRKIIWNCPFYIGDMKCLSQLFYRCEITLRNIQLVVQFVPRPIREMQHVSFGQ